MQGIRKLNDREHDRLEKWLKAEGITLNPRSLRDTYSDVRPVAKLLQRKYPSLRLEFYTSASSFNRRLQNWQVFSFRELKKLGLRLKPGDLKQLAGGKPGALDWLLFRLMSKDEMNPNVQGFAKASSLGILNSFGVHNSSSEQLDRLVGLHTTESSQTLDKDWKI